MTSRADSLRHLEREVGVLIRRIRRVIGERARSVHEDLQPASYLMLSWLVDEGPVRASAMVEQFGIDKGAVSRQLQHLDDLGLVDVRRTRPTAAPCSSSRARTPGAGSPTSSAPTQVVRRAAGRLDHRRAGDFAATLEKYNLSLND